MWRTDCIYYEWSLEESLTDVSWDLMRIDVDFRRFCGRVGSTANKQCVADCEHCPYFRATEWFQPQPLVRVRKDHPPLIAA